MVRGRQRPRTASVSAVRGDEPSFPFAAKVKGDGPSEIEQAIFGATEELLESTSLEDLTVADILERAGISRTTFYRYFTSKHHVVSAMLDTLQAELGGVMHPWYSRADAPPEKALRSAIAAVADVWARHRPVLRAASEHWHSDPEIGRRWVAMMDLFAADITKQIDRERTRGGAPKGLDSRQLALNLTWGSERTLYLAGFGIFGSRLEKDAVDTIVATWLGTIYHR
jgi:AcrR family transcriptional regulator